MCVRILRAEAKTLGLKSSFSIYDADDSKRLMTMVGRDLDLDPKRYPARSPVCADQQPEERAGHRRRMWADKATNAHEKVLAEAYSRYQQPAAPRRTRSTSTT